MKEISKRAAVAALAGVMAAGMLTGCGEEEKVDGTQVVATVNGEEIPMGILSLAVRQSQAQAESMYIILSGIPKRRKARPMASRPLRKHWNRSN